MDEVLETLFVGIPDGPTLLQTVESDSTLVEPTDTDEQRGTRWREMRVIRSLANPATILALAYLIVVLLAVIVPGLFTSQNPDTIAPTHLLLAPSWAHLFGTDNLGRDIFARAVYGARISVGTALLADGIAAVFGVLIGLISGSIGGVVDTLLIRVMDVLLSIPTLLVSLAIVTALGFNVVMIALAVGVPGVGGFARLMRSQALQIRGRQFVEAAESNGVGPIGVLFRHILPNCLAPVAAYTVLEFGSAVLSVTSLSFLGFGVQPPASDWGSLISDGHDYLSTAWWWTTLPGLVLVATVLAASTLSHRLGARRIRRGFR